MLCSRGPPLLWKNKSIRGRYDVKPMGLPSPVPGVFPQVLAVLCPLSIWVFETSPVSELGRLVLRQEWFIYLLGYLKSDTHSYTQFIINISGPFHYALLNHSTECLNSGDHSLNKLARLTMHLNNLVTILICRAPNSGHRSHTEWGHLTLPWTQVVILTSS